MITNWLLNIGGTSDKVIGYSADPVDKGNQNRRRVTKLIVSNTHASRTLGFSLYVTSKTGVKHYIVGGASSYMKVRPGYSVDIFENVSYEYLNVEALWIKLADSADTASTLLNAELINDF